MQPFARHALRNRLAVQRLALSRSISLTGAIEKGIRDGQHGRVKHERRYQGPRDQRPQSEHDPSETNDRRKAPDGLARGQLDREIQNRPVKARGRREGRPFSSDDVAPTSIAYTTASSEFIYGTFSVLAALNAGRRKVYKLYRLNSEREEEETSAQTSLRDFRKDPINAPSALVTIERLARQAGLVIKDVAGPQWTRIFGKATDARPHNGLLLEASPLPQLPVTSLSALAQPMDDIHATVGWTSPEARELNTVFDVRGNVAKLASPRPAHRYPFMLFLDRITDTGNFGAIVRSAWFLGVDAIILLEHGTAPVSTRAVKASAGALEYMPILHVKNEREFVKASRKNGWKFFAADAPESAADLRRNAARNIQHQRVEVEGALLKHPCVLILGNEETGIRDFMQDLADGVAGISSARPEVGDIDSLNVSVAAALLTQRFFDTAQAPT
ncbi:TrmH family RNA methyltransferase [Exophiala viscosa]|uniref:TrmH family RNA methyltransferase n=1 Tax=Exophiala viscosa TaxID=2486360 RepID=UPI00219188DA|nr:TrmH family RNA methyltransferase [Exophiala viscosa]